MVKNGANGDLKNHVYRKLKDRLITCKYTPGTVINESRLAAEFALSRTPIREALYRLEQDGFVQIMPKKGILVTDITVQDVLFVFQARVEIEPLTLKMSAPFLARKELEHFLGVFSNDEPDLEKAFWQDMEMHAFLVNHCGNPFIIDMMQKVFARSCRISIASNQTHQKIENARTEHKDILKKLLEGQDDTAAQLLRNHLENCKNYSLNFFNSAQAKVISSDWSLHSSLL